MTEETSPTQKPECAGTGKAHIGRWVWTRGEWTKWVQCSACGMVKLTGAAGRDPGQWLPASALPYTREQLR